MLRPFKGGAIYSAKGGQSTVDKSAFPPDVVDKAEPFRETLVMTEEPPNLPQKISRLDRKLLAANMELSELGNTERPEYLHTLLCQVGLPRRKQDARTFTRTAGKAAMTVAAGYITTRRGVVECPLPYGAMPRLALIHLCGEAVRTQNPVIDVSDGISPFLRSLGLQIGGYQWNSFKRQMTYLSCASMIFGMWDGDRMTQNQFFPIDEFSAWENPVTDQRSLWPDTIQLSQKFYETLREHAVPLEPVAIRALHGSALALDVYSWLAARLCRVRKEGGVKLSWANLKDQFGHEYGCAKDFKKEFRPALKKALMVYPDARVSDEMGGIRLYPSRPPIRKTTVTILSRRDANTAESD